MTDYADYFRSREFLSAADLEGKEARVRIREVTPEIVKNDDGKPESVLIVYFENTTKKLRLNRTNADAIKAIAGTHHIERWIGSTIVLYPTQVMFRGEMRNGIRIKPPATAVAPAPTTDPSPAPTTPFVETDDDIPF